MTSRSNHARGVMKGIKADLKGKLAVVTGANTGMGKETAKALSRMGATVILAVRNPQSGEEARKEIAASGGGPLEVMQVDLSSLKSVKAFVESFKAKHPKLDILVNNAGAWW